MSDTNTPVQAVEPDPAATSISNDQTVNPPKEDASVAEAAQDAQVKAENKSDEAPKPEVATNGSEDKKDGAEASAEKAEAKVEEKAEEKTEDKSERKQESPRKQHKGPPRRFQNQSKFETSNLKESSDHDEIRKQVEFYFSDSNLPQDAFLMQQTGGHENKSVPIKVIHGFKRMRHFQPYSAVLEALKNSTFLEVTENEEVKRKSPLPENITEVYEDRTQPRSIYVKGFGEEKASTQFDIEAFFTPYGPVNAIRLRRTYPDRKFKGSVFVEFDSEDTQKAFLALDPKPKFEGKDLEIKSKKEYVEGKAEDIKAGRIKPSNQGGLFRGSNRGGRGRGRGGNFHNKDRKDGDGERDNKDWKGRRDDFQRGGRGGRGRGRGGRGGRGRDDGPRNRNQEREEARGEKRGRDGEDKQEERPAKRVDARGIPVVETGKEAPKEKASDAPVPPAMTDA
ncbi:hypothetical protein K490DRAFT_63874 [Saccharata proteae CBS 121410]|uniref:Uncharacterized protein n=1 Tax=Saccharata proteae CBS 121410 TaxID=1314787 RepID=A0A6A5YFN9_9PEZI|nr:hypothetical protein K490DRAFT_63874 [Saccharata proteae CBS 121410]